MEKINKKRAAAYCRVSTVAEKQVTSLALQTAFFEHVITEHEGWELVEIFTDRGLTGLNVNRPEFQRMMSMVRDGKIDVIMVKSISRASRNTVDLLKTVRELNALGVQMYFCKENVSTEDSTSELLLTVYAAFAQEESRSISENVKRGARIGFSMGRARDVKAEGFKRVSRANWVVDEDEAKVIREAFDRIVEGESIKEICRDFNQRGITTSRGNSWGSSHLRYILGNVKYKGDALMQKTYTKDFLTREQGDNSDAVIPQYLKKGYYEAIVSEETFDLANRIVKMRSIPGGIPQYPYYGILRCPFCGGLMVKTRTLQFDKDVMWVCEGTGETVLQKDRSQCPQFIVKEKYLDPLIMEAINELETNGDTNIEYAQRIMKKRGKVEHGYLAKLIEKIVYIDRWKFEITWKDGTTTIKTVERYERPADIPMPEIKKNDNGFDCCGYFISGRNIRKCTAAIENQNEYVGNTEIRIDHKTGIPIVKSLKKGKKRNA